MVNFIIGFSNIFIFSNDRPFVYPIIYTNIFPRQSGRHIYRPQRSWAKVIFLQACVCHRGGGRWWWWSGPGWRVLQIFGGGGWYPNLGGGCLQIFRGVSPIFRGEGSSNFFYFFFQFLPPPKILLGCTITPPPETVNARPVRILLECILVCDNV